MVLRDQELLKQGHTQESCSSDTQLGLAEMVLVGLLPPSQALSRGGVGPSPAFDEAHHLLVISSFSVGACPSTQEQHSPIPVQGSRTYFKMGQDPSSSPTITMHTALLFQGQKSM